MTSLCNIGVIGAGAWGTALAVVANRAGSKVTLWSRNGNVIDSLRDKRINESALPEIYIDPAIQATDDLQLACRNDVILLVVPSQSFRAVCISISDLLDQDVPIVVCCKGIERGSLTLMSEIVESILPRNPIAVLSGPNFADEVARGLPTATTIACKNIAVGDQLQYALGGRLFRPYVTDDVIATEIGGAVKNVIAIACGIALGRGFGENARAALITRGLAEIARLCIAKGGRYETLLGLSGIGDLVLTCSSRKSRNMSLGFALGQGKRLEEVLSDKRRGVTEGISTAESVNELAHKLGVSMPICQAVYEVLNQKVDINEMIQQLISRPFVQEGLERT